MLEECSNSPAPHWIVFIAYEGWENGELIFKADLAGHDTVVSALSVDLRWPVKIVLTKTVNLKEVKELR